MKKYVFVLALLSITNLFSQEIKRDNFIGVWKVVDVVKEPDNVEVAPLVNSFKASYFYFKQTNNFGIKTTNMSELFKVVAGTMKKTQWKLNGNEVRIGTKKDGFSTMVINIKREGNNVYFDFGADKELPLILKVEKQINQ